MLHDTHVIHLPRNEFPPLTHEISTANRRPFFWIKLAADVCVCVWEVWKKKGFDLVENTIGDEREKISLEGEAKMVGTMLARGLEPKGRKTSAEVASTGSRGGEVS